MYETVDKRLSKNTDIIKILNAFGDISRFQRLINAQLINDVRYQQNKIIHLSDQEDDGAILEVDIGKLKDMTMHNPVAKDEPVEMLKLLPEYEQFQEFQRYLVQNHKHDPDKPELNEREPVLIEGATMNNTVADSNHQSSTNKSEVRVNDVLQDPYTKKEGEDVEMQQMDFTQNNEGMNDSKELLNVAPDSSGPPEESAEKVRDGIMGVLSQMNDPSQEPAQKTDNSRPASAAA